MSTHRTYTCNLCRENIASPDNGIGLYFSPTDEQGRHHPTIRFHERRLYECETHLCQPCLQGLSLLLTRKGLHVIA